jgi:hypothetical protein
MTLLEKVVPYPGGKNVSGVVTLLAVTNPDGDHVGDGFYIWDWITDKQSYPVLVNNRGKMLPNGPYDIQVVEERLAVISFNIH